MNIAHEHRKVYDEVYKNQYYLDLFERVCLKNGGLGESYALQNPEKICSFWNTFWFGLPDSRSIHRHPFNLICDLAEGGYIQGEVDGKS